MTDLEDPKDLYAQRSVLKPTFWGYVRHVLLLGVTFLTVTLAGSMFPFGRFDSFPAVPEPQTSGELVQVILSIPVYYIQMVAAAVQNLVNHPSELLYGLSFSLSLLFILISHEMGHYVACRIYRVDATLPFFIPTPPLVGPAGTFGAFIRILSPMPSRKAVFDIGVAGPIAGFIALLPIAVLGVARMENVRAIELASQPGTLVFTDPLLMRIIAVFFGIDLNYAVGNAFYFAAWIGLLVTALNLIPSGQLDGGHAIYAVLGERVHKTTGVAAFVVMSVLSVAGFVFFNSPSGFLIAVILAIMMRVRHPRPWDTSPLDAKRKLIAALTFVIFVLCFVPFPIRVN